MTTLPCRIDLQLVSMGYLVSPDGRWRHIPGLDQMACDTMRANARVYWGVPCGSESACAYLWTREIVLHPVLFEHEGWVIRRSWSHELAHVVLDRRCEQRAKRWQSLFYSDLIEPLWVAA